MARATQNRRIALFSLCSFNQNEAGGKKIKKYSFNEKKNIVYDRQNIIKSTSVS